MLKLFERQNDDISLLSKALFFQQINATHVHKIIS